MKIIGSVEDVRGQANARIRVLSFRRESDLINSVSEIKKQFPPYGFVFSYNFFTEYEYKMYSLVECFVVPNSQRSSNYDEYSLDSHRECKAFGFPLFELPPDIFINELSINQPLLKTFIQEDGNAFYFKVDEYIYGPFKNTGGEIVPKTGKDVNKFLLDSGMTVASGDKLYLLRLPQQVVAKVDCMTPPQLAEWLRPHLDGKLFAIDFAALRKAIELQEADVLDKPRLQRALMSLDQLSLYYRDIKAMSAFGGKYAEQYASVIEGIKKELRQELIDPFLQEKHQLEKDLKKLKTVIEQAQSNESHVRQKLSDLSSDYNNLLEQKDRLISDLKIHALVHATPAESSFTTFEEQDFVSGTGNYNDLKEFATLFNQSISSDDRKNDNHGQKIVYQLKEKKCFLAPNAGTILHLAKMSGNCKAFIQQVEPDWLKFEYFFNNGLKQIWESAYKNNELIHFFILEDINLASIECYGKPILDMLANIRQTLPVLKLAWPNNLWIFGIPAAESEGQKLGLALLKQTFVDWGAFPKEVSACANDDIILHKKLSVEQLSEHNMVIPDSINEYF
ncbi:MAG: hypothetical protein WKF97_02760 [Chitinophagaceae bacterium]